jgi:hypothetical protein
LFHWTSEHSTPETHEIDGAAAAALHQILQQSHILFHSISDVDKNGLLTESEFTFGLRLVYSIGVDVFKIAIGQKTKDSESTMQRVPVDTLEQWLLDRLNPFCVQSMMPYLRAHADPNGLSFAAVVHALAAAVDSVPNFPSCFE